MEKEKIKKLIGSDIESDYEIAYEMALHFYAKELLKECKYSGRLGPQEYYVFKGKTSRDLGLEHFLIFEDEYQRIKGMAESTSNS